MVVDEVNELAGPRRARTGHHPAHPEAALLVVAGLVLVVVGAVSWALDTDPVSGPVLVAAGLVVALAALALRRRITPVLSQVLWVVASVLLVVAAVELWLAVAASSH